MKEKERSEERVRERKKEINRMNVRNKRMNKGRNCVGDRERTNRGCRRVGEGKRINKNELHMKNSIMKPITSNFNLKNNLKLLKAEIHNSP